MSLIKPPCRLGSFNVLGHPCEEPEFALDATFHGSYLGPALPATPVVALHQLFADLLRVRLQHERGERARDLHRAAAAWHEEHGYPDEAVRHAAAAGEVVRAGRA